jgi:hypothetical protein
MRQGLNKNIENNPMQTKPMAPGGPAAANFLP